MRVWHAICDTRVHISRAPDSGGRARKTATTGCAGCSGWLVVRVAAGVRVGAYVGIRGNNWALGHSRE